MRRVEPNRLSPKEIFVFFDARLHLVLNVFLLGAPEYFPENFGDVWDLAIVQTERFHDQKLPPLDIINGLDAKKTHDSVQIWNENLVRKMSASAHFSRRIHSTLQVILNWSSSDTPSMNSRYHTGNLREAPIHIFYHLSLIEAYSPPLN